MKINVQALLSEISKALADRHPEKWQNSADIDPIRRSIVAAFNEHGYAPAGIPGVLSFICNEIESGHLAALSTFNDLPCVDATLLRTSPSKWYVSEQAAREIKKLLGVESNGNHSAEQPKKPVNKEAQMHAAFIQLITDRGFNPKAMPPVTRGLPGLRAEVAKALGLLPSDRNFENHWQRALKLGVLAYANKAKHLPSR